MHYAPGIEYKGFTFGANVNNVEFITGKAEEVIPVLVENQGITADVVVVDPPRKGCDKALIDTIIQMNPLRIVYVSCDSKSLARDLRIFVDNGFKINLHHVYDSPTKGVKF